MALITLKNASKLYNQGKNEVFAIRDISLSVEEGEFLAIVGASGSGKSTLMNILGCLDTPTRGSYFLNGEDVSSLDDDRLSEIRNSHIGFIFQGFNLIKSLNAIENVELPLSYRGIRPRERFALSKKALEAVGLGTRLYHLPNELSGGQQQRVAIARAIAARPPIILADEPTGNLDSHSGDVVMNIIARLNADGKTIVLITHDMEVAKKAKRIIRVADGKVVAATGRCK